jgi:hypothetical protein
MDEVDTHTIDILYAIIRDNDDASARYDQKEAVRYIKRLAGSGNPDAINALERLRHAPEVHPFLREILYA